TLMPFPIYYAHRLVQRQSEVRRDGRLPWLRPDAKSQLTVRYVGGKPQGIETVVLSTQHHPSMNHKQQELAEAVIEEIIKPVLPKAMLVNAHFDLRPKGIIQMLDLLRPIYLKTAAYGHFGRDEPEFTWENTDRVDALRAAAGLHGEVEYSAKTPASPPRQKAGQGVA